ncbi:hypothetical protein C8Q74DRAFT_1249610 [Fomes fomentarius]|nr:hypothetical protein C8Q74DRAFT_1249610 [Fomes fomentarius]
MHDAIQTARSLQQVLCEDAALMTMSDDDLDALERCLLESLISVRKIQNQSHRIAARYPSELLSLIFAFVVGSLLQAHGGVYAHRYPDINSLVAVSQVCSRWRTVSTTDQSLWRSIPIMRFGPEFTRLLIERSGSMPLRLFAHPASPRYTSPVLKSLKPHSARVQELIVEVTRGDYSYLSDILSPLAPSLTYLSVFPTSTRRMGANMMKWWFTNPRQDTTTTPDLRALSLSLDVVVPPSDSYPSLIHLSLTGNTYCFSVPEFLAFLGRTPLIQTVYASIPLGHASNDTTVGVHLDHLRTMVLEGFDIHKITYMFKHLFLPIDAHVQCHYVRLWHSDELRGLKLPALEEYKELEIIEHFSRLHFRMRGPRSSFWLDILIGDVVGAEDVMEAVFAQLAPQISDVETLRISTQRSSLQQSFMEHVVSVSTYAPSISSLVIANYDFQHVGKRVLDGLVAGDHSPNGHPFAALKHLVVQVDQPITDAEMLVNMVSARFRGQCALSTLTFSAPDGLAISGGGLSPFEEYVDKVESLSRKIWSPEADGFWKVKNEYWQMYRKEQPERKVGFWDLPRCLGEGW